MNKIFKVLGGILLALLGVVIVAALICFKLLDITPYTETEFYKNELTAIAQLPPHTSNNDTVQAGWSRINLLPPFTTTIAIDAKRGGKHFEGVHDSIYVRAFVFKSGTQKIAFISADLLIIPPTVTNIFDSLMAAEGFTTKNIFFTATHTHTSIGGWHNSYVGEIFAGKYDARVPKHIAACIASAIREAEKNCSPVKVGYSAVPTTKLVFNRLVGDSGKVDSILRIIKLENAVGQKAAIITFAAHATVFHEKLMKLSADWPGLMMAELEKDNKLQLASFSAGEVGSHGPYEVTKNQENEAAYMANSVAKIAEQNFDSINTNYVTDMNMVHLPFYMRSPNFRVSDNIVVRPWLFKKLFGDELVYLNTFRLGDIVFAGTPCDFSGELVGPIDSVARSNGKHLVITSFNGGYIGYVTDSRWYNKKAYETRIMGWFGPRNGDYMSEVLMRLLAAKQ